MEFVLVPSVVLNFFLQHYCSIPIDRNLTKLLFCGCDWQAYMFKYDSTHGVSKGSLNIVDDTTLEIDGNSITVNSKRYAP